MSTESVSYGYCRCGCGQRTSIPKKTNSKVGHVKGVPVRYVNGHQHRKTPQPYEVRDAGYSTPCWMWLWYIDAEGYARQGRHGAAHRRYYERLVGPVSKGVQLDHLCRNRSCINPEHLEPVTPAVNVERSRVARLTRTQAEAIRVELAEKRWTHQEIASRYGVSRKSVRNIAYGVTWN